MEETLRLNLIVLADLFKGSTGISPAAIGKQALNDNTFFGRLLNREGSFNVRTYDRLVAWMFDRWPPGAEWPADVARPTKTEVAA